MDYKPILFPLVLFFVAFFVWTLPIQSSPLPFGEGDAAWHFGIGDFISVNDHSVTVLPEYVGFWYYLFNPVLGPHALEYTPSNHVDYALMEAFGGERFRPVYIFKAVSSFLGVFAVYFLISRLYNSVAGFVAGLGLAFSSREISTYLWGQQPTLISIVVIPVFLYAFYMFVVSLYDNNPKYVYLYLASFLLASQYLLHVQGFLISIVVMAVFSLFMVLKHRRVPFSNVNLVHVSVCVLILLVFALPFVMIYLGPPSDLGERGSIGRLFSWTIDPSLQEGAYRAEYFWFGYNYGFFLLPFILAGLAFALVRRKPQDLLLLSWLVGIYVVLHLDVFLGASIVRVARMLIAEPQLFFSLAAVGAFYVSDFFRLPFRNYFRLGFSAVVSVLIIFSIGFSSFALLEGAYQGVLRVSDEQVEAAVWMASSLPKDAVVFNVGTLTYPKMRFMHVLSMRYTSDKPQSFSFLGAGKFPGVNLTPTHYVFDYSDLLKFSQNEQAAARISQIRALEEQLNGTKVYDRNNIRVYGVGLR